MLMSDEVRRVEVTFGHEQYAQLVRQAGKRGMPLAGYIRHRVLSEASSDAAERVGQLIVGVEARLREEMGHLTQAAVETMASVMIAATYEAAGRETTGAQRKACATDAARLLDRLLRSDAEPLPGTKGGD